MFDNIRFKNQFLILLTIPLVFLIFLMGGKLIAKIYDYHSAKETQIITELSISISAVVHELQKERGASAGFFIF